MDPYLMQLSPQETLVVFCDLHQALIEQSMTIDAETLANNVGILVELCQQFEIPSHLLTVPIDSKPAAVIDVLQPLLSTATISFRVDANPFYDGELAKRLSDASVKTIIISGYATEVGVMLSALGALSQGYRVIIVVDAIGSRSARTEAAALQFLAAQGAEIFSLATLAVCFESDFSTPAGGKVLSCINRILPAEQRVEAI